MSSGKWSVLIYEFFHLFAVGDSFLALGNFRKHNCIRSCKVLSFFRLLAISFFDLFWNKNILDQLSIFFPLLKLPPPIIFLVFLLLFPFLFLFFNLL